jgi:hypothetical protein
MGGSTRHSVWPGAKETQPSSTLLGPQSAARLATSNIVRTKRLYL